MNIDEVNRLMKLGLSFLTARAVIEGRLDENFEIACAHEKREVAIWCEGSNSAPVGLPVLWDLNPENFYLALDGEDPHDYTLAEYMIINADVAHVVSKLTYASSRDKDPWHPEYKHKSCGVAYRWLQGRRVTPPLLSECRGKIIIVGGMHRFHLAKYYGERRMPFLVRRADLDSVVTLIPSAT